MADLDWQSTGWGIKMANLLCCKLNLEMQDMLESVKFSFRHISKTSNTCVDFFTHAKFHYVDFLVSTTHGTDVLCLCTNSASWCSTACMIKRLRTSWNCANQSQVSHHGNIFDPPPNSSWSYRVTSSALMANGLSVWLVRRSGIPCRTACGIRLLAGTVSDNLWRRFCSQRTDAFSALEVSRPCAI